MNRFKPRLEGLEDRWNPDGPRPLDPITGLPLVIPPTKELPQGSPVVTIDVLVIQWVTARL